MTDLVSVFSTIILLTTITTLAMALFAYIAYKVRESRRPASSGAEETIDGKSEPIFLKRHMLNDVAPGDSKDKP